MLPLAVNRVSVCPGYQPLRTDWKYQQAMTTEQPTNSDKTVAPVRNDRHIWVEKPVGMPCSSSDWYSHTPRAVYLLLHRAHTCHFAGQSPVPSESTWVQRNWTARTVGVGKYWQGAPYCFGRVQHDWLVYIAHYQSEWTLLVCWLVDNQSVDNQSANNCSAADYQQSDWPDKPVPGYQSQSGCHLQQGDFQPRPTHS